MARKDLSTLRDEATKAVERGRLDKAIELFGELEELEPLAPAWPKRIAETHRRAGDAAAAVAAFERAADKYAKAGFLVQAIAVCKLILQIDPEHSAALTRLAELAGPRPRTKSTLMGTQATEPAVEDPAPPAARTPVVARSTPPVRTMPIARVASPPIAVEPAAPSAAARQSVPVVRAGSPVATRANPVVVAPPVPRPASRPPLPTRPKAPPPIPAPVARPAPVAALDLPVVSAPAIIVAPPPERLEPEPAPAPALAELELATLVPGAKRLTRADGSDSGMSVLPLDEFPIEEFELELPDESDAEPDAGFDPLNPPTTLPVRTAAMDPAARRALLTTPVFAGLQPNVLARLITRMSLVELVPNEILFREGEVGACLYVISEGEVVVEATRRELARLGPGAFFGEIALITDLPRSATIRAAGNVELLVIDRDVIRDAAAEHPEIVNVLLRFVRDRLVTRITHTSELFRPFTDLERSALSSRFELLEAIAGTSLIVQGERADGLYVMLAGSVEVVRDGVGVAVLGNGDVFGEISLLVGGGSTATVRTTTRVLALRMPASSFHEVIMTHPQVLEYLGGLAASRAASPTASTDFLDLHLDMV